MPGGAIAVASDHAGFDLKEILKRDLQLAGHEVLDLGTNSTASVDYPDFGKAMADAIAKGTAARGVLVCGTGIGISIAANRHPMVRRRSPMTSPRPSSPASTTTPMSWRSASG
jgi:ribose 5-phosphate isomerase B